MLKEIDEHKIITKFIASRLKPLLQALISEEQGGFVTGGQIYEILVIIQEAIHSLKARKENGMILKLDLAKKPMTRPNGISSKRCSINFVSYIDGFRV